MADRETPVVSGWPPRMVVCVGTVVLRGERALFVRQAEGHSLAGQWSIPWGIVDPQESPEEAALRETCEEGGITARIDGLLGIQNLRRPGWLGIIFLCHHVEGVPASDGGIETDRAAYFSLAEMDSFDEPFEPWCEWLVRRVLVGECRTIPFERDNPYRPRGAFFWMESCGRACARAGPVRVAGAYRGDRDSFLAVLRRWHGGEETVQRDHGYLRA